MAGSKSDYLEAKLLDHVYGGPDFVRPANIYVALYSVAPSDSSAGTELSGSGYARATIVNNATNFPAATGTNPATKSNGAAINFPTATADWAPITGWAFLDATTGGNMLHWGTFSATQSVSNGQPSSWGAAGIQIQED